MGEVWRGTDEVLGRTVAVKVMLPGVAGEPGFAQRFLSEATAMARVNHPAVASIHDYGTDAGVTYLVMEFVDGESLAGLLGRVGRLGAADTMRVIAQAAEGLQAVHAAGLVHRDVKPANLLIRRDGQVVVTDFGISRHADAGRLTASGAILGTPSYLSPEQVLGQPVGPLTDVYALGLTAYECLAGRRPFQADNPYAVAILRVQQAPASFEVPLPPAVLAVVERALAVDPGQRWPSAAALADAARTAGSGTVPPQAVSGSHGGPPSLGSARGGGKSRGVRAAVAVLLVGAGITVWGVTRGGGSKAGGSRPGAAVSIPAEAAVPAGFRVCGAELCPTEEMCWGGITLLAGREVPPRRLDCKVEHYMETFAAIPLPGDVNLFDVDLDGLMKRPDVKRACTPELMQERSKDQNRTKGWTINAWPIPVSAGGSTYFLHCVAGLKVMTGSVFGG
jgi:eukaryotic-like serine/threonine-protein kinase